MSPTRSSLTPFLVPSPPPSLSPSLPHLLIRSVPFLHSFLPPSLSAQAGSVMGVSVNVVCLLSVLVQPYMPDTSMKIQKQLNVRVHEIIVNKMAVRSCGCSHICSALLTAMSCWIH